MLAAFKALPLLWRVLSVVGLLLSVAGGLWGIREAVRAEGYRDGYAKAEAECEAEQRRIEVANQNAINAANKRLVQLSDELTRKELQVYDYVKALDLAAAEDPRAAEQCLGIDSVRRINAIR